MKLMKIVFVVAAVLGLSQSLLADKMNDSMLGGVNDRLVLHTLFPTNDKDEAKVAQEANKNNVDYKKLEAGSSDDYFREMDYGVTLPENHDKLQKTLNTYIPGITKEQAVQRMNRGRNNWMVWTGGNDRFWTYLGRAAQGGLDFIKTISSHPELPSTRSDRWQKLGLVNEPCFKKAEGPDENRWGLWLDQRITNTTDCPPDPFADPVKYPGIKTGSRGKPLTYNKKTQIFETGSFYGYPTGVIGFRLFPNPEFDQAAADKWDPVRYYSDPSYYNDPNIIRPYRVGMACALCHVGPNPSRPPADFNNPKWSELSTNVGAQYFWVDRIFFWDWKKGRDSFVYQLLHTSKPGTLDTSLISSDQINNPRTMNAVYDLPARLQAALKFNASEQLRGDETRNIQFNKLNEKDVPLTSKLRETSKVTGFWKDLNEIVSPRVLKDGSDSVGALGALNRVYVNIGLFGEEWVRHFIPLVGGPLINPFPIKVAEKNSLYWQANVQQTPDLALYFLAAGRPDKLADAPNGKNYLQDIESAPVKAGKKVFAENCASCHSSKLPEQAYTYFNKPGHPEACRGDKYMNCWNDYWKYTKTDKFKAEMNVLVQRPDFLENNFLSTDQRIPVNLTDSQLCSPVATNAIRNDIWDNFSSDTYKNLPTVGEFTVNFPRDSKSGLYSRKLEVPRGGRGFLRPPSLISVWSTAPFLQNNSLGNFDYYGTVEGRLSSFNDSINKLLNPDLRSNSSKGQDDNARLVYYKTNSGDTLPGHMDVTTQDSYLKIPRGYLPDDLFNLIKNALKANPMGESAFIKKGYEYLNAPADKKMAQVKALKKKNQRAIAENPKAGWVPTTDPTQLANYLYLGPIPAGIPVNLISNINLGATFFETFAMNDAIIKLVLAMIDIRSNNYRGTEARDFFMDRAADALLKASKCDDFVIDRGHYFGSKYSPDNSATKSAGLSPQERANLIEYLKHM